MKIAVLGSKSLPAFAGADAYRRAFYPGAHLVDPVTIGFQTRDWLEVMRMLQFVCS